MSQKTPIYSQPSAMEPLFPTTSAGRLPELTCEILRKAGSLSAQLPSPQVRIRVANLVREMNSYYSNLIEGHQTLPKDIERAMRADYSKDPEKRANQELNRAHIEVEKLMVERLEAEPALSIHSPEFICWLHYEFYSRLPKEMHVSKSANGNLYAIEPGQLRTFEVTVGSHQPPHHASLRGMLERFCEFYGGKEIPATSQLAAVAAAHHRLAWIHPFGDGNGRITRLHSHAWLVRCKADALGLWTLSRGLARRRKQYYEKLSNADHRRWNDLDGRGNLSDRELGNFCVFMLEIMVDQIDFMEGLLQLQNLGSRIERYLVYEALHLKKQERERLGRLLKAALVEGEIERGRVGEIVGLSGTSARELIRLAMREELLDSRSEKGPLSLAFSSKTLETYFPRLYLPVESTG